MLPQEVIRHKRDGQKLTKEEIDFFVKGVGDWSVSECQIAAFAMAVCLRGMSDDETVELAKAMASSGEVMDWSSLDLGGPVLNKHSTGGIGDKLNLLFAPMIAACGGFVPLVAGRRLGATGGTLDKLESIPGYTAMPSIDTFYRVTREVGCAVIGQTIDLAPADKRIFEVRLLCGAMESRSLTTASLLAKKLAAGTQGLIVDLKCDANPDSDALSLDDAKKLAQIIASATKIANLPTKVVLTDMNQVLGRTVGNALEVAEAVSYLTGNKRDERLDAICMDLCAEALTLKGLAESDADAREKLRRALDSGKAAEIFAKMVAALGGPADFVEHPDKYLPDAPIVRPVFAERSGYVRSMDLPAVGAAITALGGRRKTFDQTLDPAVGLSDFIRIGEKTGKDRPLAVIHARNEESFAQAAKMVQNKVQTSAEQPAEAPLIYETITNL